MRIFLINITIVPDQIVRSYLTSKSHFVENVVNEVWMWTDCVQPPLGLQGKVVGHLLHMWLVILSAYASLTASPTAASPLNESASKFWFWVTWNDRRHTVHVSGPLDGQFRVPTVAKGVGGDLLVAIKNDISFCVLAGRSVDPVTVTLAAQHWQLQLVTEWLWTKSVIP